MWGLLFYWQVGQQTHAEMVRWLGGERVRDEWMVCGGLLPKPNTQTLYLTPATRNAALHTTDTLTS